MQNTVFSLSALMQLVKSDYKPRAVSKGLTLQFEIDADIPERLIGDDQKLQQVISNLVDNAIKFTAKGTVVTSVKMINSREKSVTLKFSN